ncbi:hypothetical protein DU53_11945 [Kosmotoga sp. DU53]|nr:hypothetical protein DU53_11945 [Kosmotoga sp. DU53]
MSKKSLSILFGAGAEISYGLPSGGKFALEIFRRDNGRAKDEFKKRVNKVNKKSRYAVRWLPRDFSNKRVQTFRKDHYTSLIQSSLEHKKYKVIEYINQFDAFAERIVNELEKRGLDILQSFKNITGESVGSTFYSQVLELNESLKMGNTLFDSKYFSALLQVLEIKEKEENDESFENIRLFTRTILEFLVGACGKEFIQNLNDTIFKKKPSGIDLFDEIGGVFDLRYSKIGFDGLKFLLEKPLKEPSSNSNESAIEYFAFRIVEDLVSEVFDYQALIDKNFRYLYCPKDNWGKFCSMAIFLQKVRDYMEQQLEEIYKKSLSQFEGFYHDLGSVKNYFDIKCIGTTNYTDLIEKIIASEDIIYLNGSLDEFYDPYLNKVIPSKEVENSNHILVPFIFVQSGIKPLTSVDVSRRYVDFYDKLKESDFILVIGFGFNQDDGHINGILRKLIIDDGKTIVILDYHPTGDFESSSVIDNYSTKLRLESKYHDHLLVFPIDDNRCIKCDSDGKNTKNVLWYEYINEKIGTIEKSSS